MTYPSHIMALKPIAAYMLDDTAPFQDYSGFNRAATAEGGTPTTHISLLTGLLSSTVFSNTVVGKVEAPVFNSGQEDKSWSLEVTFRRISGGEIQVLGNTGIMDGILVDGTVVSFVTQYTTAPESRISYDLQFEQSVHVVAVHTANKNILFVNGVQVAEATLTEEQKSDTFSPTSQHLYSGRSLAASSLAVAGVVLYSRALEGAEVYSNYVSSKELEVTEVPQEFSGGIIDTSLTNAEVFLSQTWDSRDDWEFGELFDVAIDVDNLVPQFDGDTSISGQWLDSFTIDDEVTASINSVIPRWDGSGAVLDFSTDGVSWTTAENGAALPNIPAGFNPAGKVLEVRVSFPGGIVDDESYLKSLTLVAIANNTTPEMAGRTLTITSGYQGGEYPPMILHDQWGVTLEAGQVVISADNADDPQPIRTLELWVKRTGTNPTISMTGTTYINGSTGTTTLPSNQWVLMHIVSSTDVSGTITISGDVIIGSLAAYPTAMTAAQVADIYEHYLDIPPLQVLETMPTTVQEPTNSVDIYAHDWEISGSG